MWCIQTSILPDFDMMQMHLHTVPGCAAVKCGHCSKQSSSRTFSCVTVKPSGRKACRRPAVLVRAEKKDAGACSSAAHSVQGTRCHRGDTHLCVPAEGAGSQLQQLGNKASNAVSKAADNVREAFMEEDDNFLEYCSLDAKVSTACIFTPTVCQEV